MPRIAGTDIPDRKMIRYSLRYIYGIGPRTAEDILAATGIDPTTRASDLSDQQMSEIVNYIDSNLQVEGSLRRSVAENITRLREIRSYRGDRHRRGLPVRGQRTKCNARTRKGRKKTVAGKKGVK